MSETLLGALIGAGASFFGVLLALITNSFLEARRVKQERMKDLRTRLIGSRITAKEVIEYVQNIKGQKRKFLKNRKKVAPGRFITSKIEVYKIEDELNRPDLSWASLKGLSFRWQDLSESIMLHTDFEESDFFEANLSSTDLRYANFSGAIFGGANLDGANLSGANFKNADLVEVNLEAIEAKSTNFENTYLGSTWLRNTSFENSIFINTDFSSSQFKKTDFFECKIQGVKFDVSSFEKTKFTDINFQGATFKDIKIKDLSFIRASLKGVDFTGVNLKNVTFIDVDFRGATISLEQLSDAFLGENIILPSGKKLFFPPTRRNKGVWVEILYDGKLNPKIKRSKNAKSIS